METEVKRLKSALLMRNSNYNNTVFMAKIQFDKMVMNL